MADFSGWHVHFPAFFFFQFFREKALKKSGCSRTMFPDNVPGQCSRTKKDLPKGYRKSTPLANRIVYLMVYVYRLLQ